MSLIVKIKWRSGKVQLYESEIKQESDYSLDLRRIELEEIELEKKRIKYGSPNFITSKLKDNYDMDSQVKYWCDFSKQRYHDRSYVLTNKYLNTNKFGLFFYFIKLK